jgi:hypothetical protein
LEKECGEARQSSQLAKNEDHSLGPREQAFVRPFIVVHDIDRVQSDRIRAVASEDTGSKGALQGSETEDRFAITAEDQLNEAVAESTNTVVEEDRWGHG